MSGLELPARRSITSRVPFGTHSVWTLTFGGASLSSDGDGPWFHLEGDSCSGGHRTSGGTGSRTPTGVAQQGVGEGAIFLRPREKPNEHS